MNRRHLTTVLLAALLGLVLAAPARAAIDIEAFETTSSDSQAGSHPDLTTYFALKGPGHPESAKNVVFNAPSGIFGNPNAITRCSAADFSLNECPVNSQAGIITIWANYEGDPEKLLGTAPVFDMVPQEEETARFQFLTPTVNIPIAIPVNVRTADDYGLRFSVSEITQLIPLQAAKLTLWGFPAIASHNPERFVKGSPDSPSGCPASEEAGCGKTGAEPSIPVRPLINFPGVCINEPLV